MSNRPIGVCDIVYAKLSDANERSFAAREDGFAHIDCMVADASKTLALPIGCPTSFPKPLARWCATPAPATAAGPDMWDKAVRWWRDAPGALLEPWARAVVHSVETWKAFLKEVPGTRLLLDTGHVADWGGDVSELLEWADHIQLRQGCLGSTQLHAEDPRGTVDFDALFARADKIGYAGKFSIEYFDLAEIGWSLEHPRLWAIDLLATLRR